MALQAVDFKIVNDDRRGEKHGGDWWISRGAHHRWVRQHSTSRRSLFTPCRVARGPAHPDELSAVRKTEGVFADGEKFLIVDNWRDIGCSPCSAAGLVGGDHIRGAKGALE